MHLYSEKLLELLAVQTETEHPQIILRLSTTQESIELIWGVDEALAHQFSEIMNTDQTKQYRYRLSFLSHWDPIQQCYYSSLTKTFRDQSEKIVFRCSEGYVLKLHEIMSITKLRKLRSTALNTQDQQNKADKNKSRLAITITSLFIAGILCVSSYVYLSQTVFAKNASDDHVPIIVHKNEKSFELAEPVISFVDQEIPFTDIVDVEEIDQMEQLPRFPTVELTKPLNYRLPEGSVALTFDDGPSKFTNTIVDILVEHNVGATFFFIGQNIATYPEHVEYVHTNGFSIGNHSTDHALYPKLIMEDQEQNILTTNQLIEEITLQPVVLFRPPYGSHNQDTQELIEQHQMKMVLWNSDTEDWKASNADKILEYVKNNKTPGAIILLHETEETVQALPQIITYLQDQQLEIVNLK